MSPLEAFSAKIRLKRKIATQRFTPREFLYSNLKRLVVLIIRLFALTINTRLISSHHVVFFLAIVDTTGVIFVFFLLVRSIYLAILFFMKNYFHIIFLKVCYIYIG